MTCGGGKLRVILVGGCGVGKWKEGGKEDAIARSTLREL